MNSNLLKLLFKKAHFLTKLIIKAGDNYRATFALCLKFIITSFKKAELASVNQAKNKAFYIEVAVNSLTAGEVIACLGNSRLFKVTGFGQEYNGLVRAYGEVITTFK